MIVTQCLTVLNVRHKQSVQNLNICELVHISFNKLLGILSYLTRFFS